MWHDPTFLSYKVFTFFLKRLCVILSSLGLPARDYACHSFRRGGASFAFCAGLPVELIKILGDWHSDPGGGELPYKSDGGARRIF